MATDAERLEEARGLLQEAIDFKGLQEWRPGVCLRIETFLRDTLVEDRPDPRQATLDAAEEVRQFVRKGDDRDVVHRIEWPDLWVALDDLVEAVEDGR